MNLTTPLRLGASLILLALGTGCPKPPDERAFEACRAEISRRLVDPTSAIYKRVKVERRFNDGASVVDGWDVELSVQANAGDKKTAHSWVKCTLGMKLELLDLTGEQAKPEG